jgi:hypothetical protein
MLPRGPWDQGIKSDQGKLWDDLQRVHVSEL